MEDFIRVWPGRGTPEFCQSVIDAFEEITSNPELTPFIHNNATQFSNGVLGRKDTAIFLETNEFKKHDLCTPLLYLIHDCLMEYIEEFSQLKDVALSNRCNLKIQKTTAKGGYHHWHYETLAGEDSYKRELTWMVYLNDMPEGEAETEFLYQARKVKPTQGTVVIWPAGMTHVHRGNTVYTKDKYIATGWWYKT
jgi:hypothetical protein